MSASYTLSHSHYIQSRRAFSLPLINQIICLRNSFSLIFLLHLYIIDLLDYNLLIIYFIFFLFAIFFLFFYITHALLMYPFICMHTISYKYQIYIHLRNLLLHIFIVYFFLNL